MTKKLPYPEKDLRNYVKIGDKVVHRFRAMDTYGILTITEIEDGCNGGLKVIETDGTKHSFVEFDLKKLIN